METNVQNLVNRNLISGAAADKILFSNNNLLLQVISDSIVFEKMNKGVNAILGAFSDGARRFDVEFSYYGIGTAFELLEANLNEELKEKLRSIFYYKIAEVIAEESEINSFELAKVILKAWKAVILNAR